MIVPDVNLLLYAVMSNSLRHDRARTWWMGALNGTERVGLAEPALFGFLRLSTNRRVFVRALPADEAIELVESWLAQPQVEVLRSGTRHLGIVLGLLRELGTAADLTTDAQLAALAIENQADLYSADKDFARFPGLRWVNPLKVK
jgi:toxin-antitoxin system PIN domain toxin